MEIRSDRRYHLDLDPGEVWDAISHVENYQLWWPWLKGFQGKGLNQGETWLCTVQPPLPHMLRFAVHLDEVVPGKLIHSTITGDVIGTARIEAEETETGLDARFLSIVAPGNRALRAAALLIKPLIRIGHDRILDEGVKRFTRDVFGT